MASRNFRTGVIISGDAKGGVKAVDLTEESLKKLNAQFGISGKLSKNTTQGFRGLQRGSSSLGNSLRSVATIAAGAAAALGLLNVGSQFRDTIIETDRLRAVLEVATGSAKNAGVAFSALDKLASTLPLTTGELTDSYVRLKNLGLTPTEETLTSFANTAAATGKTLNQFVEAVADATTNEFERLKEFGIKARQETDSVVFTFQGAETRIEKSSEAIQGYLQGIGEAEFAGAAGKQMERLGGLLSNLEQQTQTFFRTIGDAGATNAFGQAITSVTEIVDDLTASIPDLAEQLSLLVPLIKALTLAGVVGAAVAGVKALIPVIVNLGLAVRGAAASMVTLRGAMAALFGPAGLVFLAAGAFAVFALRAKDAEMSIDDVNIKLGDMKRRFDEAAESGRKVILRQFTLDLRNTRKAIEETTEEIADLRDELEGKQNREARTPGIARRFALELEQLGNKIEDGEAKLERLRKAEEEYAKAVADAETVIKGKAKTLADLNQEQEAATEGLASLSKEQQNFVKGIAKSQKATLDFNEKVIALVEAQKEGTISAETLTKELKKLGDQAAKNNPRLQRNVELIKEMDSALQKIKTPQQEITEEMKRYDEALKQAIITQEQWEELTKDALERLEDANLEAAREAGNVWVTFGEEVSEIFRETFIRAETTFTDFIERIKETLKEAALRQLFDQTFGQLFQNFAVGAAGAAGGGGGPLTGLGAGIRSIFGGTGNVPGAGAATGGSGFGFANLAGAITAGVTGGLSGLGGVIGSLSGNIANLFGPSSFIGTQFGNLVANLANFGTNFGLAGNAAIGLGALGSIGGGFLGGFAGQSIGEALFGKEAESNIATTAGGIIGSFAGPIGSAIGAAIGGLVDSAFGGDGEKRFSAGLFAGEGGRARNIFEEVIGASGLRIAGVANRAGAQGREAAESLFSTVVSLDEALTTLATSAGIAVDFSGVTLSGRSGVSGRGREGGFFGAFGDNGRPVQGSSLENAADEFVRAWLDEVADQLPLGVRNILGAVRQTATDLVTAFEAAVKIDELIDLDVVARTEEALRILTNEQGSLADQYQELTRATEDAIANLDDTGESFAFLSGVLEQQKVIAAQLAASYRAVGIEADTLIGDTIQRLQESILNEEELYNLRRSQIADLVDQIEGASPEELSQLVNDIVQASNEAFNLLDESQRERLLGEFVSFLTGVNEATQQEIESGLAQLAADEAALEDTLTVQLDGAQTFADAVDTFTDAVDTLNDTILTLPGGQTIDLSNLPFPVNAPSEVNT